MRIFRSTPASGLWPLACALWSLAAGLAHAQARPAGRRVAEELLTIGADTTPNAPRAFANIVDVKVGRDGRIYVLDAGDYAVKILDSTGAFVMRFGSRGRQNGEFMFPVELRLTDSTVDVRESNRTSTFTLNGKFVRGVPVDYRLGNLERSWPVRGGSILERRSFVDWQMPATAAAPFREIMFVGSAKNAREEPLFRIRQDTVFMRRATEKKGRPIATRFGSGGAWALSGDSVLAYVNGYTGAITWYALDGARPRVSRSGYVGRRGDSVTTQDSIVEAERLAALNPYREMMTLPGGVTRSIAVRDSVRPILYALPSHWSVATRAMFSNDGALWTGINRQYRARVDDGSLLLFGDANTWAVFPLNGDAFTVDIRPFVRVHAIRDEKVYGALMTDAGATQLVVYQLKGAVPKQT
jgi:hypothetical protein